MEDLILPFAVDSIHRQSFAVAVLLDKFFELDASMSKYRDTAFHINENLHKLGQPGFDNLLFLCALFAAHISYRKLGPLQAAVN